MSTSKVGRVKLGVQQRMDSMFMFICVMNSCVEPDLEKYKLEVQYIDKDRGVIVASDENYEQKELPLKLAQGAESHLEPGTVIGVSMDGDVAVKLALPTTILTQIKKQ